MLCKSCGTEIAEGASICTKCATSPHHSPTATRIYQNKDLARTSIYQEKELAKTAVFHPQVTDKPLVGWLVVTDGPDAWCDFRIGRDDTQILLGNGQECQIKLHDEQLAKMHASIRLLDGKLTITDLDTITGTCVNQIPITKVELNDGDEVRAGNTTLKFRRL